MSPVYRSHLWLYKRPPGHRRSAARASSQAPRKPDGEPMGWQKWHVFWWNICGIYIYIYGIWGWYLIFNLDYIYILYGRFFWDDKLYINVDIDWYILYIFHHGSIPEFVALPAFTAVDAMNSALQNAEKHIRKVGTAALGRNPLKVGTSCDV